jgi:nitroreductase
MTEGDDVAQPRGRFSLAGNPVEHTILGRSSVRSGFSDRELSVDQLDSIIGGGLSAPSSKGAAPWRFHVVTDRSLLLDLADAVEHADGKPEYVPKDPATGKPRDYDSTVAESAQVLREVPVAVFIENRGVFSNGRESVAHAPPEARSEAVVGFMFEIVGIGAAIENMWITACSMGIGGTFMGDVVIAEETIRCMLGLRGDLVGVLALGWPSSADDQPKRDVDGQRRDLVIWHGAAPRPGSPASGDPSTREPWPSGART